MKRITFKGALKAAAVMLLLPCAVMAAPPQAGKAKNPGRPQIGEPVTAHNISVDVRNLPKAKPWTPGMGIREAHRRQYTPIGSKLPHAPASKATAADRLPELQKLWDESPNARRAKVATASRVSSACSRRVRPSAGSSPAAATSASRPSGRAAPQPDFAPLSGTAVERRSSLAASAVQASALRARPAWSAQVSE